MKEVKTTVLPCNPTETGLATCVPDIVYSSPAEGVELKLELLLPREAQLDNCVKKFPCIVFLQGSGWKSPDVYFELPQLCDFARAGYIVASVTHRSAVEGWPSPAFLLDYKCAIRFLRAHAAGYRIDRERIAAWGTSSGGNTALLAALTPDDPAYKTAEWSGESDAVKTCVACFPPTDVPALFGAWQANPSASGDDINEDLVRGMLGDDEATWQDKMREISPILRIGRRAKDVPFLLAHGDADPLVPFEQSGRMAAALSEAGCDVELVRVRGAVHEGNFWSRAVLDAIRAFIDRTL